MSAEFYRSKQRLEVLRSMSHLKKAATQRRRRVICPTSVLSNAPSLRRRIGQVSVLTSWLATRNTVFNTTNRVGSQFDAMTKLGRFAFQNNQEIDFLYEL